MKNIKTWKQEDFQGGEDNANPGHLIPENRAVQILNMLPGDEREPLVTRGGFHIWGLGHTYDEDVKSIFRYIGQAQTVTDKTKYIVDCILVADKDGNDIHVHAITLPLGDGTQTELVDDTDAVDPPGGGSKPPVPDIKQNPGQMGDIRFKPLLSDLQYLMKDYWVDDEAELPNGINARNNASYWAEDESWYTGKWSSSTPYWATRQVAQDGLANVGDVWHERADHPPVFRNEGFFVQLGRPVAWTNPPQPISGTGMPDVSNPVLFEPYMEFDLNMGGANKYLKLYFSAWILSATNIGSPALKIQYRNTTESVPTWIDFTQGGKLLYLFPRAELDAEDQFSTGYKETVDALRIHTEVEKQIGFAKATVRVTLVPNEYQPGVELAQGASIDMLYSDFDGISGASSKTLADIGPE